MFVSTLAASAFVAAILLAIITYTRRRSRSSTVVRAASVEKDIATFVYPPIKACPEPVETLKPVPYRPFRWGDYHVTMGIKNISFDSWIEVDSQLAHFHRIRAHRVAARAPQLIKAMPADDNVPVDGRDAAKELCEELCEYLSRRYPKIYTVQRHEKVSEGWYGEPRIQSITILPVNATYNLDAEDPMKIAGLLIQDDLALMLEGKDGVYYLRAGAIILPGFWRIEDKLGMSLDDIHFSGNVPQYKSKLQPSLNRFLSRLPLDKLVARNNYHFALTQPDAPPEPLDPYEIGWAESMVGGEDAFQAGSGLGDEPTSIHNRHNGGGAGDSQAAGGDGQKGEGDGQGKAFNPAHITLRQERQTLRRLPRTRAVVFTVRTYVEPVSEIVKEVDVPGRMASAIRSWPEDVAGYKSRDRFADDLLPFLDAQHAKQVAEGLLQADERPKTDYPF